MSRCTALNLSVSPGLYYVAVMAAANFAGIAFRLSGSNVETAIKESLHATGKVHYPPGRLGTLDSD